MTDDPVALALGGAISEAAGSKYEVASMRPVTGGCIHTALEVSGKSRSFGTRRYFAKVNEASHAGMFEAEADGLAAIRAAGELAVPGFIACGSDGERAWLVLEWLDLVPLDIHSAAALGGSLAKQHRIAQERFGWKRDNFIGASPQANGWSDDWLAFWRDKRLHAQLRMAAKNRLPSRMIDRGERLATDFGALLANHRVEKSLLHGDLWGGNAASQQASLATVFDPAVYVGDREADVAMTELFGGFPKDFMAAYRAGWSLDDGYTVRRGLYNLYHVLNHANLFAGNYVQQATQSIERLLAEIS
jgi:protein-ribulosamine 3-kinase